MSGSNGTGFSFTAPALFFNGQNVGGDFNFALPAVAAASTTDAYNFVGGATDAAYGFLQQTETQTNTPAYALLNTQTNYLDQIGTLFANAAQTAANNINSGGGGGGGIFSWLF